MSFTSAMPTHAEKKQGAARIVPLKRANTNTADFCLCLPCDRAARSWSGSGSRSAGSASWELLGRGARGGARGIRTKAQGAYTSQHAVARRGRGRGPWSCAMPCHGLDKALVWVAVQAERVRRQWPQCDLPRTPVRAKWAFDLGPTSPIMAHRSLNSGQPASPSPPKPAPTAGCPCVSTAASGLCGPINGLVKL
jgi:hypothetical protein